MTAVLSTHCSNQDIHLGVVLNEMIFPSPVNISAIGADKNITHAITIHSQKKPIWSYRNPPSKGPQKAPKKT